MSDDALENSSWLVSWWHRVAYTPLRDLTRGRLTARLDLKALVAHCDLPEELREVVYRTARGARLWRLERVDAAQELFDHFTDGLQAGQTPAQLRESFGDWKIAARLIGRAKRRARPLWLRIAWGITKTTAVVVAIFAILTALLVVRYRTVRPIADTSFTDALNEKARSVPEVDRAWPLYKRVITRLGEPPETNTEIGVYHELGLFGGKPNPAYAKDFFSRNPDILQAVREAATKPRLGYAFEQPGNQTGLAEIYSQFLPITNELRYCARLLRADALLAASETDTDRAIDDVRAMIAVAAHCVEPFRIAHPTEIEYVILDEMLTATGEILGNDPQFFSDEQLRALQNVLGKLSDSRLKFDISTQQRIWQESLSHLYGRDGYLTAAGLWHLGARSSPLGSLERSERWGNRAVGTAVNALAAVSIIRLAPLTQYGDQFYREMQSFLETPYWERTGPDPCDAYSRKLFTEGFIKAYHLQPASTLAPWWFRTIDMWRQSVIQRRDALLTAIALVQYRRKHGAWPQTLDALVPEFLKEIPLDRFDGKPLKYVLRDGRPELYSVGTDRHDDGGMAPQNEDARKYGVHTWRPPDDVKEYLAKDPTRRGDWILWPTPEPQKTTDDAARD